MKQLRFLTILLLLGLFFMACSSGSSDDGGTTGGSGETETSTSTSDVWMDAHDFNCSGNWTDRDGQLGLEAYSGSGECSMTFPGTSGTYHVILYAVAEYDGESPYRVSINETTIEEGTYPLSSPLGCDCPIEEWRTVCPDKTETIDLGWRTINEGDTIGFWGDDVYPCGSHGAYAKWEGIKFVKS